MCCFDISACTQMRGNIVYLKIQSKNCSNICTKIDHNFARKWKSLILKREFLFQRKGETLQFFRVLAYFSKTAVVFCIQAELNTNDHLAKISMSLIRISSFFLILRLLDPASWDFFSKCYLWKSRKKSCHVIVNNCT